jgi:CRISPR-associated protein Csd1
MDTAKRGCWKAFKKLEVEMGWMHKAYDTYNNCKSAIGAIPSDDSVPLLPVCHTTQKAQVEVVIDSKGRFRRARVVQKNDARTIIPCTEVSGSRANEEAPHPLCDKLQYVAKDYKERGGAKKQYFGSYLEQLRDWCSSESSHPKAITVLSYIQKGRVVSDLIDAGVLVAGKNGKLLQKPAKKEETGVAIFDVINSQEETFVRWEVEFPGETESRVWLDKKLWQQWIAYYSSTKSTQSFCYVLGKDEISSTRHLAKIRNDGDKAKLISSNDTSGFTFRGRFLEAGQAASVSLDVSQKAHLTLRWLISRQGYRKGDLAIVAWATSGAKVPQPTDDSATMLGLNELVSDEEPAAYTAQDTAIRLRQRVAGYGKELGDTTHVVVMAVDSATPGRLATTYYREFAGLDFLERIDRWHTTCAWLHHYGSAKIENTETGKTKTRYFSFFGAPSPSDIAEAAYGTRLDDKLRKATIQRILPCIIDGQPIPRDLAESAVRQASNRMGKTAWEWNKTLTIACALFRKFQSKEEYSMSLDPNRKTRDYLYGRLLALAESLESWALREASENRETNAARLMQRFAERPFSTWRTIELALAPYKARLGGKSIKRQRMIDEVIASFQDDEFLNDKRLSGEFLLGYHCQREFLRNRSQSESEPTEDNNE